MLSSIHHQFSFLQRHFHTSSSSSLPFCHSLLNSHRLTCITLRKITPPLICWQYLGQWFITGDSCNKTLASRLHQTASCTDETCFLVLQIMLNPFYQTELVLTYQLGSLKLRQMLLLSSRASILANFIHSSSSVPQALSFKVPFMNETGQTRWFDVWCSLSIKEALRRVFIPFLVMKSV